jgi:hypothetical protein
MSPTQYRIGTVSFAEEACPTWGTRSEQILGVLAHWGREGWRISRLNGAPRIALGARGFCLLLERRLEERDRKAVNAPPRVPRGGRRRRIFFLPEAS